MSGSAILIAVVVCVGVACLVGALVLILGAMRPSLAEERLGTLNVPSGGLRNAPQHEYVRALVQSLRDEKGQYQGLEKLASRWFKLRPFVEQSGVKLSPNALILLSGAGLVVGGALGMLLPLRIVAIPLLAALGGAAPLGWVWFKRKRRLTAIERQIPGVVELLARSLRAGRSLADGFALVAEEMSDPIATEFARCHEQQQLGMALDDALREMAERIPILDLHFFVTAIALQRQTGGDMAEILDKIGRLVRERFQIRGQIQALTGEGRLSGVVLLALPVLLGIYLHFRNPDYLTVLFHDPIGHRLIAGAIVSQLVGALVIKKIVDIRV